jgi:hypothetical protein
MFSGGVVCVDLLRGRLPMGNSKAWRQTFAATEALNAARIVPGHGRVFTPRPGMRETRATLSLP